MHPLALGNNKFTLENRILSLLFLNNTKMSFKKLSYKNYLASIPLLEKCFEDPPSTVLGNEEEKKDKGFGFAVMKHIRRGRRARVTVINVGMVKQSHKTRDFYRDCFRLSNQGTKAEVGVNFLCLRNRRMYISRAQIWRSREVQNERRTWPLS